MDMQKLQALGGFGAVGLYEEPNRSLFYRKALGLRRFYENCPIPEYRGEPLFPSGRLFRPPHISALAVDWTGLETEPELAEQVRQEFCKNYSSVPAEHRVGGNMYTHSIPNYERVLAEGLESYLPRIRQIRDVELREGLVHLVEGISCYAQRCVACLESVGAEPRLVSALKQVPMRPARDIYEAVVGWNFVLYLDGCDNLGCVAQGLSPYHRGEDITPLLENLFRNLDANGGFSMALGASNDPLTLQCLEASKGKRRPMIELFVDENTPGEVWEKAFEVIRSGNGQPAFYNPGGLLGGLQRRFPQIADADIARFCGGGCTESMLAGLSNVGSLDAGINLPLILERCMQGHLRQASGFEDFYGRYLADVKETVDTVTREISASQRRRAEFNPHPMRTLLVDDCIDNGLDFHSGGARYRWSIVNFAGLINVIDALLVLRDLVFGDGAYAPEAFLEKLRENDADFLRSLRSHPAAFGRDDGAANAFSARLSADIFSMLDDKKPWLGAGFLPASIQFQHQAKAGRRVGATPDGRRIPPCATRWGRSSGRIPKGRRRF